MKCTKCGNSLSEHAAFCPKCGAKIFQSPQYNNQITLYSLLMNKYVNIASVILIFLITFLPAYKLWIGEEIWFSLRRTNGFFCFIMMTIMLVSFLIGINAKIYNNNILNIIMIAIGTIPIVVSWIFYFIIIFKWDYFWGICWGTFLMLLCYVVYGITTYFQLT